METAVLVHDRVVVVVTADDGSDGCVPAWAVAALAEEGLKQGGKHA